MKKYTFHINDERVDSLISELEDRNAEYEIGSQCGSDIVIKVMESSALTIRQVSNDSKWGGWLRSAGTWEEKVRVMSMAQNEYDMLTGNPYNPCMA